MAFRLKQLRRLFDDDGQTSIELALCLPILLLVVTGITTFAVALNNYQALVTATSVGAQQLAISRGSTTDPCSTASAAVIAAIPGNITQSNLTFKVVMNGMSYTGTSCSSSTTTSGAALYLAQGTTASVIVTYPCTLAIFKLNNFPNCLLTAKSAQLVQ
jgi:Flp pilus assembly protein TadG